jgi:ribosomal protein L13E
LSKPQTKKTKAKEEVRKVEKAGRGAVREAAEAEKAIRREIEGLRRRPREALARPSGRTPTAIVISRHGDGMISRSGRGFSLGELSEAGVEPRLAAKWGAWVDGRRRSTLVENVSALKGWQTKRSLEAKVEERAKEVVVEVEKASRKAEKVIEEAEVEVVKVERKVRKEAKKVGKAAKPKVAKPKLKKKKS